MDLNYKWLMEWELLFIEHIEQPCIMIWSESSIYRWYLVVIPSTNKLQIIHDDYKCTLNHLIYSSLLSNLSILKESIYFEFDQLILRIRAHKLCTAIFKNKYTSINSTISHR